VFCRISPSISPEVTLGVQPVQAEVYEEPRRSMVEYIPKIEMSRQPTQERTIKLDNPLKPTSQSQTK